MCILHLFWARSTLQTTFEGRCEKRRSKGAIMNLPLVIREGNGIDFFPWNIPEILALKKKMDFRTIHMSIFTFPLALYSSFTFTALCYASFVSCVSPKK